MDNKKSTNLKPMLKLLLSSSMVVIALLLSSLSMSAQHVESGVSEHLGSARDMMQFIRDDLMLYQPGFWCVVGILLVGALLFWTSGYKIILWFRGKPVHLKVAIALLLLCLVCYVSCIKVEKLGWWFTIPVAFSIAMLFLVMRDIVSMVCNQWRKKHGGAEASYSREDRHHNLKLMAKVVLLVWGLGWMLYFIPVTAVHGSHVGAEALFHPALCALQMFALHMESTVIDVAIVNNYDVLKGVISTVSFAAALCTLIAVIGLVASRLMAYVHMNHFTVSKKYNHLYVFFGINDASTQLANDILDEVHGDPHAKVVFVETSLAGDNEHKNDTDGWKSILSMFTHHRKTFESVKENNRRALAISNSNISSLDITCKTLDLWRLLGLESVRRLLDDKHGLGSLGGDGKLFVFFLSEERKDNVFGAINVTHDELLKSAIEGDNHKFSIDIYCNVENFTIGRMLKDAVVNKKMTMHIINYSLLAVEALKRNVKNQPVSYVDIETLDNPNPGAVKSPFVSLVIGFGETGQQALKFLYEYGAFVSNQSSAENSFRSKFVCHVVDKEMDSRVGAFHATRPSVPFAYTDFANSKGTDVNSTDVNNFDSSSAFASPQIKFFNCNLKSIGFYDDVLSPIVEKLNYVVVALGDARLNISVAVDVLRYVRRYRSNLDNFKIFVRGYDKQSYDFIYAIGERYNKLVGCDNDATKNSNLIEIFGYNEKLCTYDLFIQNQYLREAKEYLAAYNELQGYGVDSEFANLDAWDARRMQTLGEYGDFSWSKLSELRRKEGQDRSNAVHAATKLEILRKAIRDDETRAKIKELAMRMFVMQDGKVLKSNLSSGENGVFYPNLSEQENKLLLNLAITEHLRWVASHEMMGYTVNDTEHRCDEVSKRHNALRPWQELDNESPSYKVNNFGVTETTLTLSFLGSSK